MPEAPLAVRVLGELAVLRDGERIDLPQSRKTRALLAYLAITQKRHRRDRLCSLFWDVTDDPRAALRWSLSKLRPLVNDDNATRIVADRESVGFDPQGAYVDFSDLDTRFCEDASIEDLKACADVVRGELLEGMELVDFHDFQAWLVAKREDVRATHKRMLCRLVDELDRTPEEALPYARQLVEIDPLDERTRATLIRILGVTGRRKEAEQVFESGTRLNKELGAALTGELDKAWHAVNEAPTIAIATSVERAPAPVEELDFSKVAVDLVGRGQHCATVIGALDAVANNGSSQVLLLSGEPGVGKTRLLGELVRRVRETGGTVFDGRAYEAESNRAYGPWIDAIRGIDAAEDDLPAALAPLLQAAVEVDAARSKERLFGAVGDLIAARCSAGPVLIVLDDIHWLDGASTELLHYVVRTNRERPVLIALATRDGEIVDNDAAVRMLRLFRRDNRLIDVPVERLDLAQTIELVQRIAPDADAKRVFEESAGNPLFVIESARMRAHRDDDIPHTLSELVHDRLDRLPPEAVDILRWGALLGRGFEIDQILELTSTNEDRLAQLLEQLERYALIRQDGAGYAFSHEVVQRVVYSEVSQPRRRLMHSRVAKTLDARAQHDQAIASRVAHHAALAGDDAMAARACLVAALRNLRLFASAEAHSAARRGVRYAEQVQDPEQTSLTIQLLTVGAEARAPDDPESEVARLEALAERALDLGLADEARIAFHTVSYLRWKRGENEAAHGITIRALAAARDLPLERRYVALGAAARCLLLIERDLPDAEALLLEANALSERGGERDGSVLDANGILRRHRGQFDEARALFAEARALSRQRGDRDREFESFAHEVMLEIRVGRYAEALAQTADLVRLAERFREGSEAPFARALLALSTYAIKGADALGALDSAIDELRMVDAKYRLAFTLTRSAILDLARDDNERAAERAEEALMISRLLQRPSEICLSLALLVEAGARMGRAIESQVEELAQIEPMTVSAEVRPQLEAALQHAPQAASKAR